MPLDQVMFRNIVSPGASINEVQAMVENHLKSVILKTFDPKKADTIFNEEGDVSNFHFILLIQNPILDASFISIFIITFCVITDKIRTNL